ncbi:hypothetical protein K8T06_01560 [bacterium]|nr:hypothetical protein [bacterium]
MNTQKNQIILIMIFIMISAVQTTNAGCTLQLHGYDAEGDGWEDSSISVFIDDEPVIEDWYVADSAHEFIEFYTDPQEIVVLIQAGEDSLDNAFRVTDSNNHLIFSTDFGTKGHTFGVDCDISDTPVLNDCMIANPADEPVCSDDYNDVTNIGCDGLNPVFSLIKCGETVCGSLGVFNDNGEMKSDSDWYEIHLDNYSSLTAMVRSDYPSFLTLYDHGDCSNPIIIKEVETSSSGIRFLRSMMLPPGVYAVRVILDPRWEAPCSASNIYTLSLSCNRESFTADMSEMEDACEYNYIDTFNGGCDADEQVFTQVVLNQSMAGKSGFHTTESGIVMDSDWYILHLNERDRPTVMLYAGFPAELSVFSGDCSQMTELLICDVTANETMVMEFSEDLVPGSYMIRISPSVERGVICTSPYVFMLKSDEIGTTVNTARYIDLSKLIVYPENVISVYGDTRYGRNTYTESDYGCGETMSGPEFVGRLHPEKDIHIRLEVIRADWSTRIVVTRNWPPEECWYSNAYRGFDKGGFEDLLLLADEDYYIFVDGSSEQSGSFYIDISDSIERTELYEAELQISGEQYYYFKSGDNLSIQSFIRNPYNETILLQKCLCIGYEEIFWFFPTFSQEFQTMDTVIGWGETLDLEFYTMLEYETDHSIWLDLYFVVLEYGLSEDLIFRSEIDHSSIALY